LQNRLPALAGWYYVPYEDFAEGKLEECKALMRITPRNAEPGASIPLYRDYPAKEVIALPRAWGMAAFPGEYRDLSSRGHPITVDKLPNPSHPAVKDPEAQAKFMGDLENALQVYNTFIAMAPTGSGKTVSALYAAAKLGRTTLIGVHLERLMEQWITEIQDKLGVPPERIGRAQGPSANWKDKDFVVAMMPSVCQRPGRYGKEFYKNFGLVICDEVHRVGQPVFSQFIHQFPAFWKFGLSATPKRKDGGEKVFFSHLGPIHVTSEQDALECHVYTVPWHTSRPLWGKNHWERSYCYSKDTERSWRLARLILKFYDSGRQPIIVGESIGHLQSLMAMAMVLGVPPRAMGQFTGEKHIEQPDGGIKRVKRTKHELDLVMEKAQITFATYGMLTEGIDNPRWDAGMDVVPRASATQLIGRIRRPLPGKRTPLWVTVLDTESHTAQAYYDKRCEEYAASGAVVH
jgi:hypothetical protein